MGEDRQFSWYTLIIVLSVAGAASRLLPEVSYLVRLRICIRLNVAGHGLMNPLPNFPVLSDESFIVARGEKMHKVWFVINNNRDVGFGLHSCIATDLAFNRLTTPALQCAIPAPRIYHDKLLKTDFANLNAVEIANYSGNMKGKITCISDLERNRKWFRMV
jgi:hypothetical protein